MKYEDLMKNYEETEKKIKEYDTEKENYISDYKQIAEQIDRKFNSLITDWKKYNKITNINLVLKNPIGLTGEENESEKYKINITVQEMNRLNFELNTEKYDKEITFIFYFEQNRIGWSYCENRNKPSEEEINYYKALFVMNKKDIENVLSEYCFKLLILLEEQKKNEMLAEKLKNESLDCFRNQSE